VRSEADDQKTRAILATETEDAASRSGVRACYAHGADTMERRQQSGRGSTSDDTVGGVTPFSAHRLGFGVLDPHSLLGSTDHTGNYVAWCRLLHAIAARHPQVLNSLARLSASRQNFRTPDGPARAAVRAWLAEWFLVHDVSYLAAIGTLRWWAANPDGRRDLRWVYPRLAAWRIPESTLKPILPDPFIEDGPTFLARASRLWRARVDELTQAGYRETRVRPALLLHCDWLADFQVGRLSASVIAERAHATPAAVKRGLRALARLLDLPLRTHRSGRPPSRNR
jgi:hypothetical protein